MRAGAKNLVIELLRFGADPKIAGDMLQGTPLDIAQKQGATEIVSLLKGARPTHTHKHPKHTHVILDGRLSTLD